MNKKTELVYAINALFAATDKKDLPVEDIPKRIGTMETMKRLDYEALLQALRFYAETVYVYTAEGNFENGCNYCGLELFPHRATMIYSHCALEEIGVVQLNRFLELWLLDDFSFALVASTETEYEGGEYRTAYRVIRSTDLDEIVQELDLDLDRIAAMLIEFAELYGETGMPTFEL